MSNKVFGKVTMSTKEYRGLMEEIHKGRVDTEDAKRGQYEYFKRADNAEKTAAWLMQFIQSDPEVAAKFREYESMNAKN